MHVSSREAAFTGVMMALGVLLVTLGGYFEGSTVFFLAAASFLAGILFRGISFAAAALFVAGTVLLSLFLAPQKLYLATFFAFCVYILAAELLWILFDRAYFYFQNRYGKVFGRFLQE